MSEQSPTVAMFRALVMLVCLIAIPLAALFGSSLPGVAKAIQERRWPTMADLKIQTVAVKNPNAEPPRFVPDGAQTPVAMIPAGAKNPFPTTEAPPLAPSWPSPRTEQAPSAVVPTAFNTPVDPSRGLGGGPATAGADRASFDRSIPAAPPGVTEPASLDRMADPRAAELPPVDRLANSASDSSRSSTGNSDAFNQVQERLRKLGATYYLLESWGDQKREFRFYCRMAIGGNAQYTRSFWSVDGDALRAMGQVLEQVESWRSGQQ